MFEGLCIVDADIGVSSIVMLGADTSGFDVIVETVVAIVWESMVKLASAVEVLTGE